MANGLFWRMLRLVLTDEMYSKYQLIRIINSNEKQNENNKRTQQINTKHRWRRKYSAFFFFFFFLILKNRSLTHSTIVQSNDDDNQWFIERFISSWFLCRIQYLFLLSWFAFVLLFAWQAIISQFFFFSFFLHHKLLINRQETFHIYLFLLLFENIFRKIVFCQ